jgi:hypothetical protein
MLKRLEENCERGDFYEAQFQFKSVFARQLAQKHFPKAVEFQTAGVSTLLKFRQYAFAVELAGLIQDLYTKSNDLSLVTKSMTVFSRLFRDHDANENRIQYLTNFLSFLFGKAKNQTTVDCISDTTELRVAIHWELAQAYWKSKNYVDGHRHFINTCLANNTDVEGEQNGVTEPSICRAHAFSQMIHDWYTRDLQANDSDFFELDLLFCRASLLLLCSSNKSKLADAKLFGTCFVGVMNQIQGAETDFATHPVVHFVKLLCMAIEKKSYAMCQTLSKTYAACIQVDPFFAQILDKIKQVHFGVQQQGSSEGLTALLRSFMEYAQ